MVKEIMIELVDVVFVGMWIIQILFDYCVVKALEQMEREY